MLQERIKSLQSQMFLRFEEIREHHRHSGNKGANTEQIVRDFLREFLPPYNRIGQGEVIDRNGSYSRQMDVVVTNEYHPFLNDLAVPSVFMIEGVACAGEVKSVLTSEELERSLSNSRSFKSLSVLNQQGSTVFAKAEDLERLVKRRPHFIFAFESQLSLETIKTRVEEWNALHKIDVPEQLDALFILSAGSLINFGAGEGTFQVVTPEGKSLPGYIPFSDIQSNSPLLAFLMWISASMLKISMPTPPILHYVVKEKLSGLGEK